jgi:hypothetical protein
MGILVFILLFLAVALSLVSYAGLFYLSSQMAVQKEIFTKWLDDNDVLIEWERLNDSDDDRFWYSHALHRRAWVRYINTSHDIRIMRWIQGRKIMAKFPKIDLMLEREITERLERVGGIYTEKDQELYDRLFFTKSESFE